MSNVYDIKKKKKIDEQPDTNRGNVMSNVARYFLKGLLYSVRLLFFWCLNLMVVLFNFITLFSKIFVFLMFIACILSMLVLHYTHHQTAMKFSVQLITPFAAAFIVHLVVRINVALTRFRDGYRLRYRF